MNIPVTWKIGSNIVREAGDLIGFVRDSNLGSTFGMVVLPNGELKKIRYSDLRVGRPTR